MLGFRLFNDGRSLRARTSVGIGTRFRAPFDTSRHLIETHAEAARKPQNHAEGGVRSPTRFDLTDFARGQTGGSLQVTSRYAILLAHLAEHFPNPFFRHKATFAVSRGLTAYPILAIYA